jgi:hypothetical protein
MIQPRHPLRRPVPMLIAHLVVVLFIFALIALVGQMTSLQRLLCTGFFGLFSLTGSIILFILARRECRIDPDWPQRFGKLNAVWSIWGPASIMGWMNAGFTLNQTWGEAAVAAPVALFSTTAICLFCIGAAERRGEERRCANCDYPTPKGTLTTLTVCSECGRSLGMPAAVVFGEKQKNIGLMAFAGAMLLVGFSAAFWTRPAGAWLNTRILTALPTPMVINEALHAGYADASAWTELSTRRLTPHEAEQIAQSITQLELPTPAMIAWLQATAYDPNLGTLAFRRIFIRAAVHHRNHFYVLRDMAMTMCATPGAADPEVRDEWFARMFQLEVLGDSNAKVGQPIRFILRQSGNATLPASGHFTLVAVPTVRFGNHIKTNVAECFIRTNALQEVRNKRTIAEFTPQATGPTQLTATAWLAYVPYLDPKEWDTDCPCPDSLGYPYLKLNPDGTAIPPSNAVWFKRLDLEKTIDVAP